MRATSITTKPTGNAALSPKSHTIWRSVDEVDAEVWNQVCGPDDLFMDLRLLKIIESTVAHENELWFIILRDHSGAPAGIACLYTFTPDPLMMATDCWLIRLQKRIQKVIPSLFAHKVLACGMPLSAAQSYLRFAPGANRGEVLATLDALMLDISRDVGARYVMLKEFSDDDTACHEHLPTLGYRRADSMPQNVAHPQQHSFDDFVQASITSRNRWSIRKTLAKASNGRIQLHYSSDADEIAALLSDEVHGLYASVFHKASRKLEWLPAEFFRDLARQLPENTGFCFLKKDDQILGFIASIFSNSTYYPLFLGIDYSLNEELDLYFNTVYAGFSDGLARQFSTIEMGQTSDYFKRHKLACKQSRRHIYIKGTSTLMHWMMLSQFDKTFPPQPLLD